MSGFLSDVLSILLIGLFSAFLLLPKNYSSSNITIISQEEAYAMLYPSPSPSVRTTPSPSPTPAPSPALEPPSVSPSPPPQTNPVGGISSLLSEVNAFRAQYGLPLVSSNSETCSFASTRASEIAGSFNHDGFRARIDNKTLPYPSYSQITENIAMNSNPSEVVRNWINSSGHAENMKKDTPFVCIASSGSYFAYEGWKP